MFYVYGKKQEKLSPVHILLFILLVLGSFCLKVKYMKWTHF